MLPYPGKEARTNGQRNAKLQRAARLRVRKIYGLRAPAPARAQLFAHHEGPGRFKRPAMSSRAQQYPDVTARVCQSGVLTLQKPTSPALFSSTLQLLCATRARLRRMEQKTATLEEKMAEIRLVNRAKWVLIEQLKMTENEAHKFIERQAMDRCVTRRTIAENILATYK